MPAIPLMNSYMQPSAVSEKEAYTGKVNLKPPSAYGHTKDSAGLATSPPDKATYSRPAKCSQASKTAFTFGLKSVNSLGRSGSSLKTQNSTSNGISRLRRHQKFIRTKDALEITGLLSITMKTAQLIKENKQSFGELQLLKDETQEFLKLVLNSKENSKIRDFLLPKKREREASQL